MSTEDGIPKPRSWRDVEIIEDPGDGGETCTIAGVTPAAIQRPARAAKMGIDPSEVEP